MPTRPSFTLPVTTSIVKPGSFLCNSPNVVCLITRKCFNGEGNYIGETTTEFRFPIDNRKAARFPVTRLLITSMVAAIELVTQVVVF